MRTYCERKKNHGTVPLNTKYNTKRRKNSWKVKFENELKPSWAGQIKRRQNSNFVHCIWKCNLNQHLVFKKNVCRLTVAGNTGILLWKPEGYHGEWVKPEGPRVFLAAGPPEALHSTWYPQGFSIRCYSFVLSIFVLCWTIIGRVKSQYTSTGCRKNVWWAYRWQQCFDDFIRSLQQKKRSSKKWGKYSSSSHAPCLFVCIYTGKYIIQPQL